MIIFSNLPVLEFNVIHKFFLGLRRPVYFQYDMLTAENINRTVDSLLSDWTQIVHLYTIVYDLAEYFKMGE